MKIAIVRGPYLNKFEMQNYEPLTRTHQVKVFYPNNNFFPISEIKLPKEEVKTYESIFGPKVGDFLRFPLHFPWGFYHGIPGLAEKIKGFEILHGVETFYIFDRQLAQAKQRFGAKLVLTVWENIPFAHEGFVFTPKIKRFVRKNTDLFIAISQRAKIALELEGVDEEKIEVIPMGVKLEQFKPAPKDSKLLKNLSLNKDDFVVSFIGRLTWEKGIYGLLAGFSLLLKKKVLQGKRPFLLIVGSGPEERKIKKTIKKLGIEDFVRFGNFSYNQMGKVHNLADVFVLPSISVKGWQEQFGMVLVEAMACGVPIITTLSGSIPEVVEEAAILVQPNDPYSLFKALVSLYRFPRLREKLKGKGLKRSQDFDSLKIAKRLENAYQKVLKIS